MEEEMALNRLEVKYVRDGIKTRYQKANACAICGTTDELEYHHYNTVDLLWDKWKKANGIGIISDPEQIKTLRESFYIEYEQEMVYDCVTLCSKHHKLLHSLYGASPSLLTANKQKNWVAKQNAKFNKINT